MAEQRTRHPLWELTIGRLREFGREPSAIFWTFGFPVLLAVGLGIAFRSRPPPMARLVVDGSEQAVSQVESLLEGVEGVEIEELSDAETRSALRTGRIDLVVLPELDVSGEMTLTYRFDSLRPESRNARFVVDGALQRGLGRVDAAAVNEQTVVETGSRYIDFLIPGLIGLNLMGSSFWGIGYAVVLARKRRLLRRLAATPMRRSHYLLAHMLSRMVFLFLEVVALVAFGWLVFDVAVHGSLIWLAVISIAGSSAFMGLALLVAARPDNTEVASGWMNAVMLPMWLLSGSFFSYERFPEVIHPVIRLLPLTALNDALRAVINEGAPFWQTLDELAVLVLWGALGFVLALKIFRWQ